MFRRGLPPDLHGNSVSFAHIHDGHIPWPFVPCAVRHEASTFVSEDTPLGACELRTKYQRWFHVTVISCGFFFERYWTDCPSAGMANGCSLSYREWQTYPRLNLLDQDLGGENAFRKSGSGNIWRMFCLEAHMALGMSALRQCGCRKGTQPYTIDSNCQERFFAEQTALSHIL
jgi:hypothetical protein